MIFLLLVLINTIDANNLCDSRTSVYNEQGIFNSNNYYFDMNTYMESHMAMKVQPYKNYIKASVMCTGEWCIDGQWICKVNNSQDCYNAEHIVPKGNNIKEINGCSLDIQGNLIMAYGKWNQKLSNR